MENEYGSVPQHGDPDGVRYRNLNWLKYGKRLVAINDATGRESLLVFNPEGGSEPKTFADIEFGRAVSMVVSPTGDVVAITNHRNELLAVDLEPSTSRLLDPTAYGRIRGLPSPPAGRWLTYVFT